MLTKNEDDSTNGDISIESDWVKISDEQNSQNEDLNEDKKDK